jgi:hypothetical protein
MTQALVERTSSFLEARSSRRGFLVRAAVVGSAVCVAPFRYLLRPDSAWSLVAGLCPSGKLCNSNYTEFCCSVVGSNECPSFTYMGGYWKCQAYAGTSMCFSVDVRYYVDCNLRAGFNCNCVCARGSCDCRHTCCTHFNYGNCNGSLAYRKDPVICRKVMCHNPAVDYNVCSYNIREDSATCTHESCTHCL